MGHITVVGSCDAELRSRLRALLEHIPGGSTQSELDLYAPGLSSPERHSHPNPLVGVIMGSDSDLPVMLAASRILEQFSIPYELTIVSAHRTPDRLVQYSKSAASRGLRTIIAGAGGAAHLPGMVAAMTALPVIGVPVKGSSLDGVDSLHSIVQMPVRFFVRVPSRIVWGTYSYVSEEFPLLPLLSIMQPTLAFLLFVFSVPVSRVS